MFTRLEAASVTIRADTFEPATAGELPTPNAVREQLVRRSGVEEAFVLRTCQRFELYAYGDDADESVPTVSGAIGLTDERALPEATLSDEQAVTHLCRVACGLESGVLGEDEVLGQVRDAYQAAREHGTLDGPLETIVSKAIRAGERARTETDINRGAVSLGSVTLDTVETRLGDLSDAGLLVVGAGDVARLVIEAADRREIGGITVANRTVDSARQLAAIVGGTAIPLSRVHEHAADADVLVTATGSTAPIFTPDELAGAGGDLLVVDLANPPDVAADADPLATTDLIRLSELLESRTTGLDRRREAVPEVEALIAEERTRLVEQLRVERLDDALAAIYSRAHALREAELEHAVSTLSGQGEQLTDEQLAVIRDCTRSMIDTWLHPKTAALKRAAAAGDWTTVEEWLRLVDAQVDGGNHADDSTDLVCPNLKETLSGGRSERTRSSADD